MDARDSRAESRIGGNVGAYRIESLLGVGGMGIVYRASGPDNQPVAIKLIKEDYARDETFLRRFSREARIAQTVSTLTSFGSWTRGSTTAFPIWPRCSSRAARSNTGWNARVRSTVRTSVRICAQVADGLQALWAAGMVHRDIKPGNILLDSAENAYITDFGLAKDSQGTALTRPGQALGSLDYMLRKQPSERPGTGVEYARSLSRAAGIPDANA